MIFHPFSPHADTEPSAQDADTRPAAAESVLAWELEAESAGGAVSAAGVLMA